MLIKGRGAASNPDRIANGRGRAPVLAKALRACHVAHPAFPARLKKRASLDRTATSNLVSRSENGATKEQRHVVHILSNFPSRFE